MQRVKDKIGLLPGTFVTSDLVSTARDDNFIHIAAYQHFPVSKSDRNRIIIALVTHER
jgi:hypothetical protein